MEHIRIGGEGFCCTRCGAKQTIVFPVDLDNVEEMGKAFKADHAACAPSPSPKRSCTRPCAPGDFYPGGKCDIAGCFEKEAAP